MSFDAHAARAQFPILQREINGHPLVYLDSAASAQKPRTVIDALAERMAISYADVHRGLHTLANETTEAYENARKTVARDRKSTRLNSSHTDISRMPSSA